MRNPTENMLELRAGRAITRILVAASMIAVAVFAWFSIRWQIGNMLGEITSPNEPGVIEIAKIAAEFNPRDPMAMWLLASTQYDPSDVESMNRFAAALEEVVRRAPHDNRWWIELGRAYEQVGDPVRAEGAFRRAIELAPSYTYPHWQFGNFLLRAGRGEEAFAELRRSAQLSSVYREQVFAVAWDYFDRNPAKLDDLAGSDPDMLAGLTKFYASREKAEEAIVAWSRMSPAERERHRDIGALVARALFEKRYYRTAVDFVRSLGTEPEAAVGSIVNGGFETQFSDRNESLFGWYLARKEKVEVRQDSIVRKSGQRSLRMNFKGFGGAELANLYQLFAVEEGASYRLRLFVKTEDLRSASPVSVEVVGISALNLRKSEVVPGILSSAAIPNGGNDWSEVALDFTVPVGVEGLQVRFNWMPCGENCAVYGTFWADDVVLEKVR